VVTTSPAADPRDRRAPPAGQEETMLRRTLMGIALTALLAPVAMAQTVDEVIAKHIEAQGGMEKIKAVKSIKMTGKMMMGGGMEAPFTQMSKRPKMTRVEFVFQGMTGIQAYDGKTGWMVMPFMGKKDPEAMPEEQSKMMDDQADMDGPLVDWKEKGNKVELLGKEQVEGADAFKLKVTKKDSTVTTFYIDAESYLQIKQEAKRKMRGTEVEGETVLGDYKEVNGLMMPFSMESGAKGSPQKQKIVVDKIEINADLPDSLFLLPAGAKPPAAKMAAADSGKADKGATKAATKAAATGKKK
jgi:outer membrane lipoprotein-sorting protein